MTRICVNFSTVYNDLLVTKGLINTLYNTSDITLISYGPIIRSLNECYNEVSVYIHNFGRFTLHFF